MANRKKQQYTTSRVYRADFEIGDKPQSRNVAAPTFAAVTTILAEYGISEYQIKSIVKSDLSVIYGVNR